MPQDLARSVLGASLALFGCASAEAPPPPEAPSVWPPPEEAASTVDTEDGGGDGGAGGDSAPAGDSGDGVDSAPPAVAAPQRAPGEVAEALEALFARPFPTALDIHATYFELLEAGADDDCPGGVELDGADPLGCVSESGYFFAGHSSWIEQIPDGPHGTHERSLGADMEITTPEGRSFFGGGQAAVRETLTGSDHISASFEISGTWRFEGAEGWMDQGVSAIWSGQLGEDAAGASVSLDGGISVHGEALLFREISAQSGTCGGHPAGSMLAQDTGGGWFELTFGGDCDGCGALAWAGEEVGTICVDMRPFFEALLEGYRP